MKLKDYEPGIQVEAVSPYAAWKQMAEEGDLLRPGDLLEALEPVSGPVLQIAKYIGFEPAQWFVPDAKPEYAPMEAASAAPNGQTISGNQL